VNFVSCCRPGFFFFFVCVCWLHDFDCTQILLLLVWMDFFSQIVDLVPTASVCVIIVIPQPFLAFDKI
jgi:hypothetical protein